MKNKFYVYGWIRKDYNTFFYIGKGKGDRVKRMQGRNKYFLNILNKTECEFVYLHNNLSEQEAFDKERETIYTLVYEQGYSIDVRGFSKIKGKHLTNQTWGGEGQSGRVMSIESRSKLSKMKLGKKLNEQQRQKLRGRIGELNHRSIPVFCLTTNKEYPSINQASIHTNVSSGGILLCCKGEKYYAGCQQEKPLVWAYLKDYHEMTTQQIEDKIELALNKKSRLGEFNSFYGRVHSQETKEKIRESRLGTKATQETRDKLSIMRKGEKNAMYGKRGENNPNFGKHRTEEEKHKQRLALGTKVRCVELDLVFESMNYAEKTMQEVYGLKLTRKTIQSRCLKQSRQDWYGELEINGVMTRLHWEFVA